MDMKIVLLQQINFDGTRCMTNGGTISASIDQIVNQLGKVFLVRFII